MYSLAYPMVLLNSYTFCVFIIQLNLWYLYVHIFDIVLTYCTRESLLVLVPLPRLEPHLEHNGHADGRRTEHEGGERTETKTRERSRGSTKGAGGTR